MLVCHLIFNIGRERRVEAIPKATSPQLQYLLRRIGDKGLPREHFSRSFNVNLKWPYRKGLRYSIYSKSEPRLLAVSNLLLSEAVATLHAHHSLFQPGDESESPFSPFSNKQTSDHLTTTLSSLVPISLRTSSTVRSATINFMAQKFSTEPWRSALSCR